MKKILLMDDDATILEIYRQRFLQEGFQVETAADGLATAQSLRVSEAALVKQAVRDAQTEVVLHFAANALVGESMTNPGRYCRARVGVA